VAMRKERRGEEELLYDSGTRGEEERVVIGQ
jgi:hypothetical protein